MQIYAKNSLFSPCIKKNIYLEYICKYIGGRRILMEKEKHFNKWILLFIVVAMTFMATLDSSIVNVVLPVMARDLEVSTSSIEWVVASYSIIICGTILFFGKMGDIFGKEKIFQLGCVIFIIGSLLCGISQSFQILIICRFIQGLGGSAYMANNHGIITAIFELKERGKALGILTTAVAMGTMIGPPTGGIIASIFEWNYIFLINIPIGIVILILSIKFFPKRKRVCKPFNLDILGAVLQCSGIVLFFGAFIMAQKIGFRNIGIIVAFISAIIILITFAKLERKQKDPLLKLEIFKNKLFTINLICAFISFTCIAASTILLPFYFQYTLKFSASTTGFLVLVSPIVLALFSPICGSLSDKIEREKMCLVGLLIMGIAFLLLSTLKTNSIAIIVMAFMGIMSLGQAIFQPANNTLVMSNCSRNQLGIAGSINSLTRNLGQIVGITLSTSVLYAFMSYKMGYKVSGYIFGDDKIFLYGMNNMYIILALLCGIGVLLNLFRVCKMNKGRERGCCTKLNRSLSSRQIKK